MVLFSDPNGEECEVGLMRVFFRIGPCQGIRMCFDAYVLGLETLDATTFLQDAGASARPERKNNSQTHVCRSADGSLGPRPSIDKLQAIGTQAQRTVRRMDFYARLRRSLTCGGGDHPMHEIRQSHVPCRGG